MVTAAMKLKDACSLQAVMTNLDSIFKSRDITLSTKLRLVKAMVFPVFVCGCESWTMKKAERRRIDAFELWCWRSLLRVPWTARRSNQVTLKEISPGCSLVGLMLKLKLQYFGHLMRRTDSLRPHGLQHTRLPCPSPVSWVYSNSRALSWWCHPTISSSVIPFFSCLQSFPASGSFPMSQLFAWGGQSIGVAASKSGLPMNTQGWSPLGWTDWISLQSKGLSRVFSNTTVQKHQFFNAQLSS